MTLTSEEHLHVIQTHAQLIEAKKIIQQLIEQALPMGGPQSLVVSIPRATLDAAVQFSKDYIK